MQTWVKQSTNLASLFESRRRARMTKSPTKKKKKKKKTCAQILALPLISCVIQGHLTFLGFSLFMDL